jgi:hypothetical protein
MPSNVAVPAAGPTRSTLASSVRVGSFALLGLLGLTVAPGVAFQLPRMNLAHLAARADVILLGRVEAIESGLDEWGLPATLYRLRATHGVRGARAGDSFSFKQYGVHEPVRVESRWLLPEPEMPRYSLGGTYLLLLTPESDIGFRSPVGGVQGVFAMRPDGTVENGTWNAGLFELSPFYRPLREEDAHLQRIRHQLSVVDATGGGSSPALLSASELVSALQELTRSSTSAPEPRAVARSGTLRLARRGERVSSELSFFPFQGIPHRWDIASASNPQGSLAAITWHPEIGRLSDRVSNVAAVAAIEAAFAEWASDPLNTIVAAQGPSLGVDADARCPGPTCYLNFWQVGNDGLSPVLFDEDGSILQQLTGSRCASAGLGGMSGFTFNPALNRFLVDEGQVLINGILTGALAVSECGFSRPLTLEEFRRTFVHEVGHLLGLFHTVVNGRLLETGEEVPGLGRPTCQDLEVMGTSGVLPDCFPVNTVPRRAERRALEYLYPSAESRSAGIQEAPGTLPLGSASIAGRVWQNDGATPADCVNVIARNLGDPFGDAGAWITGSRNGPDAFDPNLRGVYELHNLDPDASYVIEVGALSAGGAWPTLCAPLPAPPLPEYWSRTETGSSAQDNPACFNAVKADGRSNVDLVLNDSAASSAPCECVADEHTLCLGTGERFQISARFATAQGLRASARVEPITADTGYFWFFDDDNVEAVLKVLDGCSFNDSFWVFAAGLTDVEVELDVLDTQAVLRRAYRNEQGVPFRPILDTVALRGCAAASSASAGTAARSIASALGRAVSRAGASIAGGSRHRSPTGARAARATRTTPVACQNQLEALCLARSRFEVEVAWRSEGDASGRGQAVSLTDDTGYFWFFDEDNVEMVIKVLDACVLNQRFWVFAGGLTDVEIDVLVRDSETGAEKRYSNPPGTAFEPIQDTGAFATCP